MNEWMNVCLIGNFFFVWIHNPWRMCGQILQWQNDKWSMFWSIDFFFVNIWLMKAKMIRLNQKKKLWIFNYFSKSENKKNETIISAVIIQGDQQRLIQQNWFAKEFFYLVAIFPIFFHHFFLTTTTYTLEQHTLNDIRIN